MYRKGVRRYTGICGRHSNSRQQPRRNAIELGIARNDVKQIPNGTKHRKNGIHDKPDRRPMIPK